MIIESHIENNEGMQGPPEIITIHSMGEYIADNHAVGYLASIGLSAHSLIDSIGTNYRCRKDLEMAYHAKGFNTNSLGIEFLVPGSHTYLSFLRTIETNYISEQQYQAGLTQIKEWLHMWPIKKVVRHSDLSPERKVDPGNGFPWERLINDIGM